MVMKMKTAIILHGKPSKEGYFNPRRESQSNSHWLPWLQCHLILNGILAQTPELPEPYKPDYKKWSAVLGQFKIDRNTILVGHSRGAGFLIRWLSENKKRVGRVALVAPSLYPRTHGDSGDPFFNFNIDSKLVKRTGGITIFYSTDDMKHILETIEMLHKKLPGAKFKKFTNKGHFTFGAMKTEKFPELLRELTK